MSDPAVVLSLLAVRGESYGLDLVRASDGRLSRGTIYVTLTALEEQQLVTSRQEDVTDPAIGIPRRLYRLTPRGRAELTAQPAPSALAGLVPVS
jgi:DNA-binding PadR family transcriptional regulator